MKTINKLKRKWNRLLKERRGAAEIVEYTVVLPFSLIVIMILLFTAYYLNERAVIDAAAHRSVLLAEKMYFDGKFKNVTEMNYDSYDVDYVGYKKQITSMNEANLDVKPYRFLFNRGTYDEEIKKKVKEKAYSCIRNNQLFPLGDKFSELKVDDPVIDGTFSKKITVTIHEEFHMPRYVTLLFMGEDHNLYASAATNLSAQPELIRNVDLAYEIAEDVGLDEYLNKLKSVIDKITNFVNSLEEG